MSHYTEEGDICKNCGEGMYEYPPAESCSCHIRPPCSTCTDRQLECPMCGYVPDNQ